METLQKNINDLNKNLEEVKTEKNKLGEKFEEEKKGREIIEKKLEEENKDKKSMMKLNRKIARQSELLNKNYTKPRLLEIVRMYDLKNYSKLDKPGLVNLIMEHEESLGKFSTTPRNSPIIKPPEKLSRRSSGSK